MENTNFNNEKNNQENEILNENTEETVLESAETIEIPEGSANYPKKKKKVKKEKSPGRELFEWIQAIVIAVVLAFVIKTFLFGVVNVEGPSMEPTLKTNDRMILWKLGYEPKHGDIIVFSNTATDGNHWIKRVIATEGEHVRIDYNTNSVFVNEKKIDEPYINVCQEYDCSCDGDSMKPRGEIYDIIVPEGCVFAMGDNRNHSKDCRDIGPVSENDILGKAILRFWPMNKIKTY